jgi:hypothetical protein
VALEESWDALTFSGAARFRRLSVLKWAHENGYPWDKFTCTYAAINDHFEVLQWEGKMTVSGTLIHAAELVGFGQLEMLVTMGPPKWLPLEFLDMR